MDSLLEKYVTLQTKIVCTRLKEIINAENVDYCFTALANYFSDQGSSRYIEYYLRTTDGNEYFLTRPFFREFKKMYSLQGIDNHFLDQLEKEKDSIYEAFKKGRYLEIYQKHFSNAKVKYGKGFKEKELGSFYSKLLSTLGPDDFTALDQPVKNYLGLGKESFIVAYSIINDCYRCAIAEKGNVIVEVRKRWKLKKIKHDVSIEKISDLKLIDLIMWYKANKR